MYSNTSYYGVILPYNDYIGKNQPNPVVQLKKSQTKIITDKCIILIVNQLYQNKMFG